MNRSMLLILVPFAALFLATPTRAEIFCATTALELSTALNDAAFNGEDDVIRVQTGTYDGGGIHDFDYQPAFGPTGDVGTSLILIGGYTPFFDNPCGQILVEDPQLTVLDGGDVRLALLLYVNENSDVQVRLLTFASGFSSVHGGGLVFGTTGIDDGTLTIERNAFIANEATAAGAGLRVHTTNGYVRVINNLFFANNASHCAAASITSSGGTGLLDAVAIANNTAIFNTVNPEITSGGGGGICVGANDDVGLVVYNNNLWGNDLNDLSVAAESVYNLHNNNLGVRRGSPMTSSSGNISVEPVYESGLFNFTPTPDSPLVDAGHTPQLLWYLTEYDLLFHDRLSGPAVDIGAYESALDDRIFRDGFDTF